MNITIKKCLHCRYKWIPRILHKPKTCPKCKSYNWDKPPKIKHRRKEAR